jgi:hypothetical protein
MGAVAARTRVRVEHPGDPVIVEPAGAGEPAAAAAGEAARAVRCLCRTFAGALEARGVAPGPGALVADGAADLEGGDGALAITRLHVTYTLRAPADADRAAIDRAFAAHMPGCAVYRALSEHAEVTSSLELAAEG